MRNMTLRNIAQACRGTYFGKHELFNTEVSDVVLDSRKVGTGTLFIATKGERVDGHDFVNSSFEAGAVCAIVEQMTGKETGPVIQVESSFQALKDIAAYYREQLSVKVVGITGSVGKTSTKEVIASVISQKYQVLKTEGNFNNEVGLPLTVLRIREEHEVAVLEMGISDFGEMERLSTIAKPDICVITNIGLCHLENLKTQEGILKAKTEMFHHMSPGGSIILNGDDKLLQTIHEVNGLEPQTFGYDKRNSLYVDEVESLGLSGTRFTIHDGEKVYQATVPLPGVHMVINSAAAALIGRNLGLTTEEIQQGIASVEGLSGRSHLIHRDNLTIIDDCYNANPVSMKSALELLCFANTRKVAILGDMFELGENSDRFHYEVGVYAGEKDIDLLLLAGENSKHMAEGARTLLPQERVIYYTTGEQLENDLENHIKKGDSVLVKASHGMHYEGIVKALSDRVLQASAE